MGGLSLLDPQLPSFIEELRREHALEIERSYELTNGNAIFRGALD